MEQFALNDEVAALEAALSRLEGAARLDVLIPLAWQLRERHSERSLKLADEAEALLAGTTIEVVERQRSGARLTLVRGEINWLFTDLETADTLANAAHAAFARLGDPIGTGDAKWLLVSVCNDRGQLQRRDEWLASAIEDYRAGGDPVRIAIGTARSLRYEAFRDVQTCTARLTQLFDPTARHCASVMAWLANVRAILASETGDPGGAIKYFSQSRLSARESGQIRMAITAESNGADCFATLGDLNSALKWNEGSVALARSTGWTCMVGFSLMQAGNVLRLLGHHVEARSALVEALAVMKGMTDSQTYAIALEYLGDLALDVGDPAAALDYFVQAEARSGVFGEPLSLMRCWRRQALALCRLDRARDASAKVAAALAMARQTGDADEQIQVLRVCAELCDRHTLRPPEATTAPSATLHYLNQAMTIAETISGYTPPVELLDEVASAHAALGDFQQAYANGCRAAAERGHGRHREARNRAIAMQVRQETERAHADAQHHRQLAQAEAARAAGFQEARATLETLGLVGREITASLNADAVFATLYRHVTQLLDAAAFDAFLLEPDGRMLRGAFAIEAGQASPPIRVSIDDPASVTARCARERQEIATEIATHSGNPTPVIRSVLLAPLLIGDRLLGVMSIQSRQAHAYGERERSIFRTLCAYGAIALDNAGAYAVAESARQQANQALVALDEARNKLADRAAWLAEEVHRATDEIVQRERETVIRLCKAAEYRDPETGGHILRMAHYSELIARGLGLSVVDQELILRAAPMHDVGKMGITDNILLKPGRLDFEEFEVMKQHALYGYEILKGSSSLVLQAGATIARSHHERFDGTGYPHGLKCQDIPMFGRIVAVADVFDALTSERPYKQAWTLENAAQHIRSHAGSHFDPACVASFFQHWSAVLEICQRFKTDDLALIRS